MSRPVALFAAMPIMRVRILSQGRSGSVRHVAISLPLVTALLDDRGRYFLPGAIAPADASEPPVVLRRRGREADRRRARALRDIEETRTVRNAVELLRRRDEAR